jgi:hypothetical protein
MQIALRDIFNVVSLTMVFIEHGVGINAWRQRVSDGLLPSDHPLRTERTNPPTKQGGIEVGNENTIWHNIHNEMMLPALKQLKHRVEGDGAISNIPISIESLDRHEAVLGHIRDWRDNQSYIHDLSIEEIPENRDKLSDKQEELLEDEINNARNNLIGRILQARYAELSGEYELYGLPPDTGKYFKGSGLGLTERTLRYARELVPKCPLINIDEKGSEIALGTALEYYFWMSQPYVLEMLSADFTGAALGASQKIADLLGVVYEDSGYQIDLRDVIVSTEIIEKLHERKIPYKLREMEMFFDLNKARPTIPNVLGEMDSLRILRQSLEAHI